MFFSFLVVKIIQAANLLIVMQHGRLEVDEWNTTHTSSPSRSGSVIGAALAAHLVVPPNEKRTVDFVLAWDSPEVKFLKGRSYLR